MIALVSGLTELVALWTQSALAAMVTTDGFQWPIDAAMVGTVVPWVGMAMGLLLVHAVSSGIRRSRAFTERVLIVGTSPLVSVLIDEIEQQPGARFTIIGVIDDAPDGGRTAGLSLRLGSIERLGDVIEATEPDRIVIALADRQGPVPVEPLLDSRVRGVAVEEGINFFERVTGKLAIEALPASSLILSDGFRHSDFVRSDFSMALVRGASLLCAAAGLILLMPLLAIIAIAIRLDSRGPIFFVQDRVGRGGHPFGLIKFRTMHVQSGRRSEWVRDNVDRITGVGRWLRRFRLDELPQFVNVLRGEMNLVGPRPHPVSNYQLFLERIPYYGLRSAVRPGITGWAQVRYGYANSLEEETEKMRYDLYYIKHRSVWLDLQILGETVALLAADGRSHESARRAPGRVESWPDRWHGTATRVASR
jgi:exopolysaccharide biosynthesis polyprenyl glycosylphosphotransferase